ncbi:MAG: hypothetical protein KIT84_37560 [Labilithrix sp.]|nr:hypothetical protein [Labilithrix sp.]MCW5816767.1 hypothetical protein [Labilithrix sp.]
MTNRLGLALVGSILVAAAVSACSTDVDERTDVAENAVGGDCGGAGQACCATGPRCEGELGCSGGVCADIDADMVAYTEYCKEQLGFANPRVKMAYMSCFDAAAADGSRVATGRQALLTLSRRDADGNVTKHDLATEPETWDRMFGGGGHTSEGCDNPNYLQSRCDPYYRLNVFKPDPGNNDITAAIHCRSDGSKPTGSVLADARRRAYEEAPASMSASERERLFDLWNDSNEVVLTMTNTRTGKACFFHAKSPYFGSHFPAPDDETDLTQPGAASAVWDELPVTPPFSESDSLHRSEWLRNGKNAWQRPDYMRCVGCHDSGPFMHDPFIDSTNIDGVDYLPRDRANRPYLPLGWQGRNPKKFLKTGPVREPSGELGVQKCTMCHQMGTDSQCGNWFDRAVGWSFPWSSSEESKRDEALKRYMPFEHGFEDTAGFYAEYGASIDAMKCCCEHQNWRGCKTVPAATPMAAGTEGTDARSCTESTCGAWNQDCCNGTSCNHSGLTCRAGTCKFKDE